jgi:hypothetical protein
VTDRKPPGVRWQTWVDRQIEQARAEGAFDDLPGNGRPLGDVDRPYDELWWVRRKLQREGVSVLPPGLALRKEVEDRLDRLAELPTEAAVRALAAELNTRIREVNAGPAIGPPARVRRLDAEQLVGRWRGERAVRGGQAAAPEAAAPTPENPGSARGRWAGRGGWGRRFGRRAR